MRVSIFTYALFLVIFFIGGCKETTKQMTSEHLIEGSHLDIDAIKSYLPEELKLEKDIRYIAESGEAKKLKVSYKDQTQEKILDNQSYITDEVEIGLFDESDPTFQISLLGSANYNSGNSSIASGLTIMLMPGNQDGSILGTVRFNETGQPQATAFDNFHNTITLNDKNFNDCYLLTGTNPNAFSEIYLNADIGIVAFRDFDNELFVFEEYVE